MARALRPIGGRAVLVDWEEVAGLVHRRLGPAPSAADGALDRLGAEYDRMAAELAGPLLELTGPLPRGARFPPFQALTRHGWVDVNLDLVRPMLAPILAAADLPRSRATELGRQGLERYLALMLATLARRVLGQFDAQLLGHERLDPRPRLFLVEPNIVALELEAGLPGDELRRWLILHEMTHAWQFAAHPWLRDHLDRILESVVAAAARAGTADRWRALSTGTPAQWAQLRRLQATMSLVEGYGNLVMHLVGRRVLPSLDRIEAAQRARARSRHPLEAALWRLTGLELKLQQYRVGGVFCQDVFDLHGIEVLNLAWADEANLPDAGELRRPDRWVRRVTGRDPHAWPEPA